MNNGGLKTSEVVHGVSVHRPLGVDFSDLLKVSSDGELRSWGGQMRFFSSIMVNDILCCAKLANQLTRAEGVKFDMACVHDWMGAMAAPTLKGELSLPVVFHVHSTEWGRSGGRGSKAVGDIEYLGATTADDIVTVSYAMKEDLAGHGWPAEKIHVVWNGIDPDTYGPSKAVPQEVEALRKRYGIADGQKMILFVGRLNWVKGIMNLV